MVSVTAGARKIKKDTQDECVGVWEVQEVSGI